MSCNITTRVLWNDKAFVKKVMVFYAYSLYDRGSKIIGWQTYCCMHMPILHREQALNHNFVCENALDSTPVYEISKNIHSIKIVHLVSFTKQWTETKM